MNDKEGKLISKGGRNEDRKEELNDGRKVKKKG